MRRPAEPSVNNNRAPAGDILSLVEKAEQAIEADEAQRATERLLAAKFDFNDFLAQFKMMNNMGSMGAVMKMLPGAVCADGQNPAVITCAPCKTMAVLQST